MMNDTERKLAERMDALFMETMLGGKPQKRRQTALRVRGRSFETVELDDAGNVIEPVRCICGRGAIMHQPKCPFYCLVT
jgi:hypothetical protein